MDINNKAEFKDGDEICASGFVAATSVEDLPKQQLEGSVKKKRRRGKSKRKIVKPYVKVSWQDRRYFDTSKRSNRCRKIVLAKTNAPFNNNQFLMEIHKPEPENSFQGLGTPSARTRHSSFSVDSEDNYFFSLPEDEEEYLTKEFSSVYEDAQSERLTNMSKNELIQEYLLLEVKYENLVKRTERSKLKQNEHENDISLADKDIAQSSKESSTVDKNTSSITMETNMNNETVHEMVKRLKDQDEEICQLQIVNEKLRIENELLRKRSLESSSEDSESDSSSSSNSCSSSSRSDSHIDDIDITNDDSQVSEVNGENTTTILESNDLLTNGVYNSDEHYESV